MIFYLFIFMFYLFIHETQRERERERGRDTGRGRSRLPVRSPRQDSILGPRDHDPSQRWRRSTAKPPRRPPTVILKARETRVPIPALPLSSYYKQQVTPHAETPCPHLYNGHDHSPPPRALGFQEDTSMKLRTSPGTRDALGKLCDERSGVMGSWLPSWRSQGWTAPARASLPGPRNPLRLLSHLGR